jgi:competence protein ComEA
LNQAMPQWRAFSSDAPTQPPAYVAPDPGLSPGSAVPPRGRPGWIAAALVVLGGIITGGALVALLAVLLLTGRSTAELAATAPFGDALDGPVALSSASDAATSGVTAPVALVVDVAGAVVRPGLHRLRPGDRVGDAIEAAGGFGPRADLSEASRSLNLAQPLDDGVKVLVPELSTDQARPVAIADGRIDLNRADQAALETLPGIGPVTARKIIESRDASPFDSVRQLRSRSVVGQSVFDDIKDLVRI